MIGDNNSINSEVNGLSSVVSNVNTFDDQLASPGFPDPFQVIPCDNRLFEGWTNLGISHGPIVQLNIGEIHQPPVAKPLG